MGALKVAMPAGIGREEARIGEQEVFILVWVNISQPD
jgi:hypothetical protein